MTLLTDRAAAHRVSRAEFERFREERDDGFRYELLDGEILVTPSPAVLHQHVVRRLLVRLDAVVPADHRLLPAPLDVLLGTGDADTVLQPDLVLVRGPDLSGNALTDTPLLVVEVLSPTTWHRDLGAKMVAYATAGVPHYWVVAPRTPSLTSYRLGGDGAYVEVAHVEGDQVARVTEPVVLELSASSLVR